MVKIRLRRTGAKKKPQYRVVVADSRSPRDGRFIEILGHYNPRTKVDALTLHEDRALYWLSVGAQPTDIVKKLLTNSGTFDKFSRVRAGESIEDVLGIVAAAPVAEKKAEVVEDKPAESEESASTEEEATTEENVTVETDAPAPTEDEAPVAEPETQDA